MKLYLRLLWNAFLSWRSKKINYHQSDQASFRVLPFDLDLNFHLNNSVYLSFMDIGRMRFVMRTSLFQKARQNGWGLGVAGSVYIIYFKSLGLWNKFELHTRLVGHHQGWFYIEQKFERDDKIMAAALVKVTFLKDKRRIPAREVMSELGISEEEFQADYLESAYKSEKNFINYLKKSYSSEASNTSQV